MHGQHGANGQSAEKERAQSQRVSPRHNPVQESSSRKSYTTKDGRRVEIGECALFQAGNAAPPFIGIVRKVTVDKDSSVRLTVNWLYRPADVKLVKGVPIDAAPNEIFYSFHKDDTPAASLLHPCKVAFLRKGVELPAGISSFVCRRVYDTSHKRLWWLTDRDYTDEHQEEVDQLLNRTKLEMQAVVQQGKGKKRERSDPGHEPSSKRIKPDDSESSFVKVTERGGPKPPEEIASFTDKDGGLINPAGVDKLVTLMQQDKSDGIRKPMEVASRRILLAGVVASTDKQECRDRLVQLGGLAVLDDWLQEAHKGKSGDGGGNPAEVDKLLDDLLLTLLRALQKLPVDLDALKASGVGKSVNHLKNHKNLEIQKKARKLVDTWKKRVKDAEMKQSGGDKPGTPGKQAPADALTPAKDAKSSTKAAQHGSADAPAKSVGSATSKSSSKENSPNNSGSNEIQGASVKEERSSASQSHGPTWSSAPVTSACKEDVKVSKSGRSKGDPAQKENKWSRTTNANSAERPVGSDKSPGESEPPLNQRVIVRFPNPGKSPARTANGDSAKVSSPKALDRSSSSGLGEGALGKSKHHAAEISSEKRHRSDKGSDKPAGTTDKDKVADTRQSGKNSDKALRDNVTPANAVNGGMSLLATVAADEMLKCDGSCVTVSTPRSVLTEEGNGEQDNVGTSSGCPAEQQLPSSEQRETANELPKNDELQNADKEDTRQQKGDEGSTDMASRRTDEPTEAETTEQQNAVAEKDADNVEGVKAGPVNDEAKEVEREAEGCSKPQAADSEAPQPLQEASPAKAGTTDEAQTSEKPSHDARPDADDGGSRPLFDLNEGFNVEESPETQAFASASNPLAVSSLSAPIPVMASTIGSFIPPASTVKLNKEAGWRGSAATSAFRRAEPRAAQEKKGKLALEFDLNVAEGEETDTSVTARSFLSGFPSTSTAGLPQKKALDLNEVNGSEEGGSLRLRPPSGNSNSGSLRNFDLNDGPSLEESGSGGGEDVLLRSFTSSSKPKAAPVGVMNGGELLNLSSWLSAGSSYPSMGISGFPGRPLDQPPPAYSLSSSTHPFVGGPGPGPGPGAGPFSTDLYRAGGGGGGASSSTISYQSNPQPPALYSYQGFPFNSSFPFSSASTFVPPSPYVATSMPSSFSTITSQVANGPGGRQPYFIGVADNGGAGVGVVESTPSSSPWRRSLDLNSGPDAAVAVAQQQAAMAAAAAAVAYENSADVRQQQQQFTLDDPVRAFHQQQQSGGSGGLKRKEPESGWDDVYRRWP